MFKRWLKTDPKKSALLIGPRRSGKTTYLKKNFPDYKYSTLDDYDFLSWANNDPKGFISHLGKQAIIDEIQRCPKLTIAVKYAIDNNNAQFMMSGSSSQGLLDTTADSMAGRINIISLPTACWGEPDGEPEHSIFKKRVNPAKISQAQRSFNDALYYGQFPEVVSQKTNEQKKEILKNYKSTYFIRDIIQFANLENAEGLMAIFHHLARSIGSHLEVSNYAREAGLSYPTAKKYL
ncbi:MAG: AAA family ATPase, partial [Acidobacteriota bacterium]|nr:AAA family ATPase [Acidobacteriota bacterium]